MQPADVYTLTEQEELGLRIGLDRCMAGLGSYWEVLRRKPLLDTGEGVMMEQEGVVTLCLFPVECDQSQCQLCMDDECLPYIQMMSPRS